MEEDTCEYCGCYLSEEDYENGGQTVPYGMGSVEEVYIIGYKCPECSLEVRYY